MTDKYTQEDDDEISLHSFDSERSGEPVEYQRNTIFSTPIAPKKPAIFPSVETAYRVKQIAEKQPRRRRVQPISLQTTIPEDVRRLVGSCFVCSLICQRKVFGEYYMCTLCAQHSVGLPLHHPKIKLIIELRKENEYLQMCLAKLDRSKETVEVVDYHSRINAMNRVIAGFIYDHADTR
jgi:hypothetical protein